MRNENTLKTKCLKQANTLSQENSFCYIVMAEMFYSTHAISARIIVVAYYLLSVEGHNTILP